MIRQTRSFVSEISPPINIHIEQRKLTPKAEARLLGGVVGIKLLYAPCLLETESQAFLLTSQ